MKTITIENSDASDSVQIHSNTSNVVELGYSVRSVDGLEFPSTRIGVINRGGEHGAFIASSFYGERRITLEGRVAAGTDVGNEERRRDLETILAIERDSDGLPSLKTLKFTTLGDIDLQIKCSVASPLRMSIERPLDSPFQIDLVSDYPIEGQTANSTTFTSPSGGGFILAVDVPIVFAASSGSNKTLSNVGTTEAYPILTFSGPLTNPSMHNQTLGKTFAITKTLISGDTLVVDMREKTATLNGTTNALGDLTSNSEWIWLVPADNTMQFATSGGSTDTGNCVVAWRDSYLGV